MQVYTVDGLRWQTIDVKTNCYDINNNNNNTSNERVQKWQSHCSGMTQRSQRRGETSGDCGMWTEMVWMLHAVADRSTRVAAMEKALLNEGNVARWNSPTGRVHQQGTMVLLHVSTCIQGQQAWSQFVSQPSASAADGGVSWCGHTSMKKTPAEQTSQFWATSS